MKAKQSVVLFAIATAMTCPRWLLGAESKQKVAGSVPEKPKLELTWRDAHRLYTPSKKVAKEVQAILHGLEVVVDWKENDVGDPPDDSIPRIRVVVTPSEPGGAGWRIAGNAMGRPMSRSPRVRLTLFGELFRIQPKDDGQLLIGFPRALGLGLGRSAADAVTTG